MKTQEQFELRRYHVNTQSNLVVGPFRALSEYCYEFSSLDVAVAAAGGGIFQVYPNDPTKCFYQPIPVGYSWYVLSNRTELLASIDYHDHYAFFGIPVATKELHWVRARSLEEAKMALTTTSGTNQ